MTLNTSSSNSSFTFTTCTLVADQINVNSNSIEVFNATRTATIPFNFPTFFNHTEENTNYNCLEISSKFGLGADLLDQDLCLAIFSSELSFFESVGTLFSVIIVAIILSAIALILMALKKDSVTTFADTTKRTIGGIDLNNTKLVMILIGVIAMISIITIMVASLMCNI